MPSRINGIGTWYWGRNNIITRNAKCEFCGNAGQLISYDTTLYFTVLFLPVIPLQRKRVLNECPRCRRHRVIPLKKWEEQKTAALVDALNAWQADRQNADKARQAVNVTVGYQDRHAFEDLAPSVAQAFGRDADVQMFVASGYDHFNQPAAAETGYRSAVAARNDPSTRRAYAAFLMRQLRPDDAKPLLADILATKDRTGAQLMLLEAQAYQAAGNHVAASTLLDETTTAFPDLLSTPDFQRISALSAKYRGTNKRVKISGLDPSTRGGAKDASWFHRNGAKAVICAILAIAAAWYLIDAASSGNHAAFIVNGTSQPYQLVIDGGSHGIPAKSFFPLDLKEGHYTIKVTDHPEIEPASFDIKTNFWTRPFDHRTFVINPDRIAVLYERDVVYASKNSSASNAREHAPTFYVGQVLYNVKKPDDAFTEPPSTVDLSSESSTVTRRHLSQFTKLSPAAELELIQQRISPAAATDWMKRFVEISSEGPESMELLGMLSQQLSTAEMIAYLRPRLGDRPVRVLWHRIYQTLMEKQHPEYDLAADYRAMLAKNPGDAALIYLTGRSLPGRDEMRAMFQRAANVPNPCAYALYALAYEDLGELRFAPALSGIQRALRIEPKNIQFLYTQGLIWEALGQTNSAIDFAKTQETHDGGDSAVVVDQIRLLAASGNRTAAQQRIEGYCAELNSLHVDKETIDQVRQSLTGSYSYTIGDIAGFKTALKDIKSPEVSWEIALADKDYDAAEQALSQFKKADYDQYLLLSALAGGGGNQTVSNRAWDKAKELLAKGDREERELGKMISAASAPSPQTILQDCPGYPADRCALRNLPRPALS